MAEEQNPYQPPSIAAAEEVATPRPAVDPVVGRYLRGNNVVSTGLITLGFGGAFLTSVRLIASGINVGSMEGVALAIATGFGIGVLGIFQRRHNLAAMTLSGALAVLGIVGLAMLMTLATHDFLQDGSIEGHEVVFFVIVLLIGLALTVPLQVAYRAWTWHRQGVDLKQLDSKPAGHS